MMNWLASVGTNFNNIQTLHQVGQISGPFDNAHQDPGHHAPSLEAPLRPAEQITTPDTRGSCPHQLCTSEEAIVRSHCVSCSHGLLWRRCSSVQNKQWPSLK
ncbi:hypothetical protein TNCT_139861 [Trichonephila clavata]|uniref:Uncharacterized protein n=1 Tax=Trichonephila clavata TaxID=2740835 RepID=A0A8X6HI48_TRICU|nr:hypothetical protein TNCT_139861 [Trichonephila clavata]